jgi:hypothetical protein
LEKYPENHLVNLAENELKLLGYTDIQIEAETSKTNNKNFKLNSYPNPFNPTTTISYELPKDAYVKIKVYNSSGQKVKTLANGFQVSGKHEVVFDGTNLASGIYFYKFETDNFTSVKKILLVK